MSKKVSTSKKAELSNKSIEEVKNYYLSFPVESSKKVCDKLKVSEYLKADGSKGFKAVVDAETLLTLSEDEKTAVLLHCAGMKGCAFYIGKVFHNLAEPAQKVKKGIKTAYTLSLENLKQLESEGAITHEEYIAKARELAGF